MLESDSDLAYYYARASQRLGRTAQASAAFEKTVKMAKGEVKAAAEQALRKRKKPAQVGQRLQQSTAAFPQRGRLSG